ncbi:RNA polymerase sigma factor [Planctomycetota bacterium]|nr:RNA polymerase sigma factor [Planctomycetota bacterium]
MNTFLPNEDRWPLAQRALSGDEEAIQELAIWLHATVRALGSTFQRIDVDDVTQSTVIHIWQKLATHEPKGSFAAWIQTVARRKFIDAHRKSVARNEVPLAEAGERTSEDDHAQQLDADLLLSELRNFGALGARQAKHARIIEQRALSMSFREIAIADGADADQVSPALEGRYRQRMGRAFLAFTAYLRRRGIKQ